MRPTLNKRAYSFWLPVEDAERLNGLAQRTGQEPGRLIIDLIRPYLDADKDEVVVPLTLDRDLYEYLYRRIEDDIVGETDEDREAMLEAGLIESVDEVIDMEEQVRLRLNEIILSRT